MTTIKPKRTARKGGRKAVNHAWAAAMEEGFVRIQKTLEEIAIAHKDLEKAHRKTEKTLEEIAIAHKDLEKAHRKTEKTLEEIAIAHEKLEKVHAETARQVGDLGNKFGDIAEQMLTPALVEKFEKLTFPFTQISRNVEWNNKEYDLSMEIDALLEDGTKAMIVEVKSKLNRTYVEEFIGKMEKVRHFADLKGDGRQFYGAMAAMTADKTVIKYVLDKGFYLIMPSGDDVKITVPSGNPKVW